MRSNKAALLIVFLFAVSTAVFTYFYKKDVEEKIDNFQNYQMEFRGGTTHKEKKAVREPGAAEKKVDSGKIPEQILIDVPFAPQAPYAVWDEYHKEACEEASLMMLKYYLDDKKLTPEIAEREIQNMISFQVEEYGDYKDSDAEEIVELASDFYGIKNLKVVYDFKKEDIKKELTKGFPIIVPAAGRLLGNPFYTSPGPLYHNLVLVGYENDVIITNDPGTKRGGGYRYNIDVLYNAIHDFPGKKELIEEGKKAMIIVDINNK
ncbi:hypothetical protein BMS3Abin15_00355 [bacterium BMS3Abin15]|nr:hypothetical protein BMS3Abin15_00355 [bacterium BMS3Abin15]